MFGPLRLRLVAGAPLSFLRKAASVVAGGRPTPEPLGPLQTRKVAKPTIDGDILGKTRRGRSIVAHGADDDFDDNDHHDAGQLHARLHDYHAERGAWHKQTADDDPDWRSSEKQHGEHARHQELAEHHAELARLHLTAGGGAQHLDLDLSGESPRLGAPRSADDQERAKARKTLRGRGAHQHPGGVNDADRAEYAKRAMAT